jgi:hypothetical protein
VQLWVLLAGAPIAVKEGMRFDGILDWFSGKARDTIVTFTIPALVESEELGYWKKGVARKVRATLNKQNVAAKWSRAVELALGISYSHPLYEGLSNMRYGSYGRAPLMLAEPALGKLRGRPHFYEKKGTTQNVGETIERWARANAEVAELIALLDERRPKPVVVMKTLSPTIAKTISGHIGLDVATIQSPPMHGEWVEFEYKGKKCRVYEVVIDWPEDTLHNKSRFFHSGNHQQCQACGHAIQNAFNWVPILAYNADKVPHALWVGRDCAKKLFGCEVDGDAIYKGRTA